MIEPEDLNRAWFQTVLAQHHSEVRVAGVEITHVDEMTNTHVRVALAYEEPNGAPPQVFVKLPTRDAKRREMLGTAGMGRRETRFYQRLAPHLDLRVPSVHGAVLEDDGGFAIVLEDLAASGCTPYDGIVGVAPDAAAFALEELASMHVRFEDPDRRVGEEVSWLTPKRPPRPRRDGPDLGALLLQQGIDNHRDRLGDAYVAVAEQYIDAGAALVQLWLDAPPTVLHGDTHLGNLFSDRGRVGFLDWGVCMLGDPLRDVAYFCCLALDIEVRRAHERDLVRHYLDARQALDGRLMSEDEAWERYRIQSAYVVPASCQAIRVPGSADDQTRAFSDAFLRRAVAAVDDLETPAVITAARD